MTAEVQDVCAKRVTQRRTRKSIAAGQSPDQYQVRRCQPAIPAPILQAAHQVSTSAPLDVFKVVHKLVARPITKIAPMAAQVTSSHLVIRVHMR